MKTSVSKFITTTTRITISPADVLSALGLPPNAELTVRVPGGGDWSNTNIEVDDDCPLVATYESQTCELNGASK